jgi:hypothetical protein
LGAFAGKSDRFKPNELHHRLEFVTMTRRAYDDIALQEKLVDSLIKVDVALKDLLKAYQQRYDSAEPDRRLRENVLKELSPFLNDYVDALQQPLVLLSQRRTALELYRTYRMHPRRVAQVDSLLTELVGLEVSFRKEFAEDRSSVDALRQQLGRAVTSAAIAEFLVSGK